MEIWNEFIFIRFKKGPQSSVAELLERFDDEISNYNKGGFYLIDNKRKLDMEEYIDSGDIGFFYASLKITVLSFIPINLAVLM